MFQLRDFKYFKGRFGIKFGPQFGANSDSFLWQNPANLEEKNISQGMQSAILKNMENVHFEVEQLWVLSYNLKFSNFLSFASLSL